MDRGGMNTVGRGMACLGVAMSLAVCASGGGTRAYAQGDAARPEAVATAGVQPAEPTGRGSVVEIWVDRESGVASAWLSNGVLFHHKRLRATPPAAGKQEGTGERRRERSTPEVAVCVTIAGSELLETAENRGISDAAVAAAWSVRSVRSMEPHELIAYFDAARVSVRCHGGADSFMLTATCDEENIEAALRGVRLLLSEPLVDEEQLGAWKERTIAQFEERKKSGNDAFDGVVASLFGPQEARARRPQPATIRELSAGAVQEWLDGAIGGGVQGDRREKDGMPMEVAIVGDIAVDQAMRLAEKYIASLPSRARMTPETFADRRIAARAERPPEVLSLDHWEGDPLVLVGFFGTDIREIPDHRALTVAARILSSRLDRLPPEHNEGEEAFAVSMPSSVYPGFGLFLAATRTKEGNVAGASENIRKLLDDLMVNGPSEEELKGATTELGASANRLLSDPVYWARTLSRSMYHGFRISEIARAEDVYRTMPSDSIIGVLAKYCTPERSIRLIVKPGASEWDEGSPRVRDE